MLVLFGRAPALVARCLDVTGPVRISRPVGRAESAVVCFVGRCAAAAGWIRTRSSTSSTHASISTVHVLPYSRWLGAAVVGAAREVLVFTLWRF